MVTYIHPCIHTHIHTYIDTFISIYIYILYNIYYLIFITHMYIFIYIYYMSTDGLTSHSFHPLSKWDDPSNDENRPPKLTRNLKTMVLWGHWERDGGHLHEKLDKPSCLDMYGQNVWLPSTKKSDLALEFFKIHRAFDAFQRSNWGTSWVNGWITWATRSWWAVFPNAWGGTSDRAAATPSTVRVVVGNQWWPLVFPFVCRWNR